MLDSTSFKLFKLSNIFILNILTSVESNLVSTSGIRKLFFLTPSKILGPPDRPFSAIPTLLNSVEIIKFIVTKKLPFINYSIETYVIIAIDYFYKFVRVIISIH